MHWSESSFELSKHKSFLSKLDMMHVHGALYGNQFMLFSLIPEQYERNILAQLVWLPAALIFGHLDESVERCKIQS